MAEYEGWTNKATAELAYAIFNDEGAYLAILDLAKVYDELILNGRKDWDERDRVILFANTLKDRFSLNCFYFRDFYEQRQVIQSIKVNRIGHFVWEELAREALIKYREQKHG